MILNGKPFNPGELRIPVKLKSRTVSVETGGFMKPGTAFIDNAWAKWVNVHGAEAWAAGVAQGDEPATVTIRYHSELDGTCIIEMGGKDYEILSLDNIQQRNEYIELKVKRWRPA